VSPMPVVSVHDSLAYVIYRTARLLRWHFVGIAAARGTDLTQEQWFVLNKLRRQPGVSQTELGESLFADRPNMTRMLAAMERRGWIRRAADPEDGRRTLVHLTAAGRNAHDLFAAGVEAERARLFAGIPEGDLAVARRVLEKIERNTAAAR
jgi:DNA-binding MarR family transcriptional regulator